MGERAPAELGLPQGSFAVEVVHHTLREVQWSCIADGVQAATGVIVGKLNLRLAEAAKDQEKTVVTNRNTGQRVVFRLHSYFLKRYLNLPYDQLPAAGREAMAMPESQIFTDDVQTGPPR